MALCVVHHKKIYLNFLAVAANILVQQRPSENQNPKTSAGLVPKASAHLPDERAALAALPQGP